jgi:hypothetical protein
LQTKHEAAIDEMLPGWQKEHQKKMEHVIEELSYFTEHIEHVSPDYETYEKLLANPQETNNIVY